MPQIGVPLLDVYSNRDNFTGRHIESAGMQRLSPENRHHSGTSEFAKLASKATVNTMGALFGKESGLVLSPVQIDYLVGGYLGWLGERVVASNDVIAKSMMGETQPDKAWSEYQPFRRFYRDLELPGYAKYQTQFYEDLREVSRIQADINNFRKMGEFDQAKELQQEHGQELRYRKLLNRIQQKLSTINTKMKLARKSNLTGEEKRRRLDVLQMQKNRLTKLATEKYRG